MRAADRSDGLVSANQEFLHRLAFQLDPPHKMVDKVLPEMGISSFPIQCIMAEATARTPSGGIRTVRLPIGPVIVCSMHAGV